MENVLTLKHWNASIDVNIVAERDREDKVCIGGKTSLKKKDRAHLLLGNVNAMLKNVRAEGQWWESIELEGEEDRF